MHIRKKTILWLALYFLAVLLVMATVQVLVLRLFKSFEEGSFLLNVCRIAFMIVWMLVTYGLLTFRYKWLEGIKKRILKS